MRRSRHCGVDRGVSELYGTLLVIGLTVVLGIVLITTGTFVVQQLTSSSEASIGQDTMYELNQKIDEVAGGSATQFSTLALPETDGEFRVTESDEFTVDVTPREDYANRTQANESGALDETWTETLGAIVYEDGDGNVLSYQAGGLWEQDADGGHTAIRSTPYLEFTGDRIDFGFVDLTDTTIQDGSALEIGRERSDTAGDGSELLSYVENRTDDIYNPSVGVPADVTITIESRYADGWKRYAEEQLSAEPANVTMVDEETVEIAFGQVGDPVWEEDGSPTFGEYDEGEIVYSGLADYAYKYQNSTDHANISIPDDTSDPWRNFSVQAGPDAEAYEVGLYNDTEWIVYDPDHGVWLDRNNETVEVDALPAVATTVEGDTFSIRPPAELQGTSAVPVCVVSKDEVGGGDSDEELPGLFAPGGPLTEPGEGCFEQMIGVGGDDTDVAVGELQFSHEFELDLTREDDLGGELHPADELDLNVTVENVGEQAGTMNLATFFINNESYETESFDRAIVPDGDTENITRSVTIDNDRQEYIKFSPVVPTEMAVLDTGNWTVFVTTGDDIDSLDEDDEFDVTRRQANFTIASIEPIDPDSGNVTDEVRPGSEIEIDLSINETDAETDEPLDRVVSLTVTGNETSGSVPIAQRDIEIDGGGQSNESVDWSVPTRLSGQQVEINATVSPTGLQRTVEAGNETEVEVTALEPDIDVAFESDEYVFDEDEDPTFNVIVENDGDRGAARLELASDEFEGDGDSEYVELDQDETEEIQLELVQPRNGEGEVSIEAELIGAADGSISSDTAEVTVGPQFELEEFTVFDEPVTPGENVLVSVSVANEGAAGSERVDLAAGPAGDQRLVNASEIELAAESNTNANLTWTGTGGSLTADDDPLVTVSVGDDTENRSVDVASELIIESYEFDETVIEQGDDLEIDGDDIILTNTGDEEVTQTVELAFSETDETDTVEVTLGPGKDRPLDDIADNPDLEIEELPRTGAANISSDDDYVTEQIIVDREGPECDEVSYDGNGTENDPYRIKNVDQLQCIGDHDEADLDDHYELVNDIDASGTENWNDGKGFDPIGDSTNSFDGAVDGNGNKIEGLYINRAGRDGVGLIGVAGGYGSGQTPENVGEGALALVERLRLVDVEIHGNKEVGGIGGNYAGTIIDSSVEGEVHADEQRVGLVVGRANNADLTNRIVGVGNVTGGETSAEVDRGIGAILGRPSWYTTVDTGYAQANVTGPENVGGLMGSSSRYASEFEQMYFAGNVTATKAPDTAGAITGLIEEPPFGGGGTDIFTASVYWETDAAEEPYGTVEDGADFIDEMQERSEQKMRGLDVIKDGNMGLLNYTQEESGAPWTPVPDDYPRFEWELEAEGEFEINDVDVDDDGATEGDEIEVTTEVTNTNPDVETQTITLQLGEDGTAVDLAELEIDGYDPVADDGIPPTETVELTWETELGDSEIGNVTVETEDDSATEEVTIDEVSPEFEITDVTPLTGETQYEDAVPDGAELPVNVTIENTGDEDNQLIALDGFDRSAVDVAEVELSEDETETVTLTWNTAGVTDGESNESGEISVASNDDRVSENVTVVAQSPELTITDVSGASGEIAGTPFGVDVTVANEGEDTAFGAPLSMTLSREDSEVTYSRTKRVTGLEAGADDQFQLETLFDVQGGEYTLTVETDNATVEQNVSIGPIELDELETNEPVLEGDTLNITAPVAEPPEESITVDIKMYVGDTDIAYEVNTTEIAAGETTATEFTWNTKFGDAGDRTITVEVDTLADIDDPPSAAVDVEVNEVNPVLDDATIRTPDSVFGIDLTDLTVDSED